MRRPDIETVGAYFQNCNYLKIKTLADYDQFFLGPLPTGTLAQLQEVLAWVFKEPFHRGR